MQSNRELLELAAKAGGYEVMGPVEKFIVQPNSEHIGGLIVANDHGGHSAWNSLRCDGDALRLAVRLGMRVRVCDDLGVAFCTSDDVPTHQASEGYGSDRYAATRRAITRAAAQLAQAQEGK